jgi:hypothetical protein
MILDRVDFEAAGLDDVKPNLRHAEQARQQHFGGSNDAYFAQNF